MYTYDCLLWANIKYLVYCVSVLNLNRSIWHHYRPKSKTKVKNYGNSIKRFLVAIVFGHHSSNPEIRLMLSLQTCCFSPSWAQMHFNEIQKGNIAPWILYKPEYSYSSILKFKEFLVLANDLYFFSDWPFKWLMICMSIRTQWSQRSLRRMWLQGVHKLTNITRSTSSPALHLGFPCQTLPGFGSRVTRALTLQSKSILHKKYWFFLLFIFKFTLNQQVFCLVFYIRWKIALFLIISLCQNLWQGLVFLVISRTFG